MGNDQREPNATQKRVLGYYEWSLAIGWTLVIAVLLAINFRHEASQAVETARTQARSNFQRDVIYRHWNAGSGAVYAPVSGNIQPNPYLAGVPDRDIITPEGKKLTLINPSYMTRLVFDMADQSFGVKGHLTSLRPIRPENVPDAWESAALKDFVNGTQEVSSVETMSGNNYLRLMKPLKTEEECLKCHSVQGYRVGEIRGGLSVAVPMEPLLAIARQNNLFTSTIFIFLWGIGLTGIFFGSTRLHRTILQRNEAEREIVALNQDLMSRTNELETANRELDAFCSTVSHDLRTPLTIIGGYGQLINNTEDCDHSEKCRQYTTVILESVRKMENLITTLLKFSHITRGELVWTSVNLSEIAYEIALELRMKEPERGAIFQIAPDLTVNGDKNLIRVVMQNLVGNAWKYTGKCNEALIEVGVTEHEGKTAYFVRDNGIGFDSSKCERMFDAFQRLDNATDFEGTGIGLATVKRIITRHGGHIECEGAPGEGATFYFSTSQ